MSNYSSNRPDAVAELKTSDGTFLIVERRETPRNPIAIGQAPQAPSLSSSPQMMALGGLIILGVLVASYTTKYDAMVGHAGGPLSVPAVGFLALQLFLARASFRLFHDIHTFDGVGSYVQNRLIRYLPAVIPAVLLGYLVTRTIGCAGSHAELSSLPANLLMLSDMVGIQEIDNSHWRLKIEIIQSTLVALMWFTSLRRHLPALLTIGLAFSALNLAVDPARSNVLTLQGFVTSDGYLPLFAFGAALHHVIRNRRSPIWWALLIASGTLASFSNTPVHAPVVALGLAILALIGSGRLSALGRIRPLTALGQLAFPIYVVHFVTGFALINHLEGAGCPALIAILVAATIAIALGAIVNITFERPAERHATAMLRLLTHWLGTQARAVSGALPGIVRTVELKALVEGSTLRTGSRT